MEITQEDIDSLATKLATLDLSEGERGALAMMAGAVDDAETAGFFSFNFEEIKVTYRPLDPGSTNAGNPPLRSRP